MELHLELSTSSHIGIVVNALEAGNVGMPQLSLLHWSLCLATVKFSAKPMIEPWKKNFCRNLWHDFRNSHFQAFNRDVDISYVLGVGRL